MEHLIPFFMKTLLDLEHSSDLSINEPVACRYVSYRKGNDALSTFQSQYMFREKSNKPQLLANEISIFAQIQAQCHVIIQCVSKFHSGLL